MILTRDDVDELSYGGLDGYEVLENEIKSQGRWSTYHRLVFRKDGELWAFDYETGSTESQEVDRPETVECYRVEAVPSVAYRALPKHPAAHGGAR